MSAHRGDARCGQVPCARTSARPCERSVVSCSNAEALRLATPIGITATLVRSWCVRRLSVSARRLRQRRGLWAPCRRRSRHALLAERRCCKRAHGPRSLSHVVRASSSTARRLWGVDLADVHVTRRDGTAGRQRGAASASTKACCCPTTSMVRNGVDVTSADSDRPSTSRPWPTSRRALVRRSTTCSHRGADDPSDLRRAVRDRWSTGPTPSTPTSSSGSPIPGSSPWASPGPATCAGARAFLRPSRSARSSTSTGDRGRLRRLRVAGARRLAGVRRQGEVREARSVRARPSTDVVLREKRREELICELTGWRCIRITWADLAYPERLVARIRDVPRRRPTTSRLSHLARASPCTSQAVAAPREVQVPRLSRGIAT